MQQQHVNRPMIRILRIAGALAILSSAAGAQIPGIPVLQNAWATPGIVAAFDFGGGNGSTYAGAVGWTPGSGRFQISAGLGANRLTGYSSKFAYGARLAIPFGAPTSTFGFAAFAGIGGRGNETLPVTFVPTVGVVGDSIPFSTEIPLGASIGWRHAIGATHGLSVYATPAYVLFNGGTYSSGVFRAAIGADVGITSAIGATVGVDFGGTRTRAVGGPTGSQYGIGVSYALGHR